MENKNQRKKEAKIQRSERFKQRQLNIDEIPVPKEDKKKIKGIFITHGHDQQIGALADILVDIPDVKIYGGKFTLEIIKQDLEESNIN